MVEQQGRTPEQPQLPFSDSAQKVMDFATQEAKRLNFTSVTPDHLLLALVQDKVVKTALKKLNILPYSVQRLTEDAINRSSKTNQPTIKEPQIDNRSGFVIDYAYAVATVEHAKEITPLYLLIGIIDLTRQGMLGSKELQSSKILNLFGGERSRNNIEQLKRLARGLEIDPFIEIAPSIADRLRQLLEDPNINDAIKSQLARGVDSQIQLAQESRKSTDL